MYQNDEHVTIGEWLLTMLILVIPLVNIVMMFVWAFGSNTKPSKANFFKAYLIVFGICILLGIAFAGSILALISAFAPW